MKSFLDEYSLDDACDDIVHLDIHENKYDFLLLPKSSSNTQGYNYARNTEQIF